MSTPCGRVQSQLFRASWSVEDPYVIKVTPVDQNIFPERVTAREIEVYGFDHVEVENRCKRRLAQYRSNPARFQR